jgi:tetratricopeptide (TPR) repeat protein
LGNHEGALTYAELARELALMDEDSREQMNALMTLGMIQLALGDYSAARDNLEIALALARELGDLNREATALGNLGVALTLMGDYQHAQDNYRQDLKITREINDRMLEGSALTNLAWVSSVQGEWRAASEYAFAGAEMARQVNHKEALAESLVWLGHARLGSEGLEEAIAAYTEALTIRRALSQQNLAMGALAGLSRTALARGDLAAAVRHVREILAYLGEGGTLDGTWEPLRIYLTCFQVLNRVEDPGAGAILQAAYDLLQDRAAKIRDEADRRSYLENVPWHREIVTAWEKRRAQRQPPTGSRE